jgi:hypothetical protein
MCAEVEADASDVLNDYYCCPFRTCHRINFQNLIVVDSAVIYLIGKA